MTLAIFLNLERPVFTMSPLPTTHEHQSAATSMREATTIEYIVLLMTDIHPAALRVLHGSLTDPSVLLRLRPGRGDPEEDQERLTPGQNIDSDFTIYLCLMLTGQSANID